ncbi:MAG: hypothetical protein WCH86_02260 [Kiritimatiellales bacterium]
MTIRDLIDRLEDISAWHGDQTPILDSNGDEISFSVQPHPVTKVPAIVIF